MPNTTWNPSDRLSCTLSGGNLTATGTNANTGVRSVDFQTSGKYYWEYCPNVVNALSFSIGIANSSAAFASVNTTVANACFVVYQNGVVYMNSSITSGISIGNLPIGASGRVCIALDMTNKLIWFRNGIAGNWNANATYNPATGVGGLNIAPITSTGIYALFSAGANGDQVIANFGDTAFSGVVPSGFTAGFPPGGGGGGTTQGPRVLVMA